MTSTAEILAFRSSPERLVAESKGRVWSGETSAHSVTMVAEEVPVVLRYNGIDRAVVMATPANLQDLALGYSLSEGLLESPSALMHGELEETDRGMILRLEIAPAGSCRTGCGPSALDRRAQPPLITGGREIVPDALRRALDELPDWQVLNRMTDSLHAAAWSDTDGAILFAREDIGRHNALDKLIGAMAMASVRSDDGFVVVTGRCDYATVRKAAAVGIATVAAVAAPTALAVRAARAADMTLVGPAPTGGIRVHSSPARVTASWVSGT